MPLKPRAPDASQATAIRAWKLMDNQINWVALDAIVEMLGVDDVEMLILQLHAIRDFTVRLKAAANA